MIMLWGIGADGPLAAVRRVLERSRVPFAFIDQHALVVAVMRLSSSSSRTNKYFSPDGCVGAERRVALPTLG